VNNKQALTEPPFQLRMLRRRLVVGFATGLYLVRDSVEVTSSSFIPEKNVVLLKTKRKTVIRSNAKTMRMEVAFPPGSRIESGFITRLLFLTRRAETGLSSTSPHIIINVRRR